MLVVLHLYTDCPLIFTQSQVFRDYRWLPLICNTIQPKIMAVMWPCYGRLIFTVIVLYIYTVSPLFVHILLLMSKVIVFHMYTDCPSFALCTLFVLHLWTDCPLCVHWLPCARKDRQELLPFYPGTCPSLPFFCSFIFFLLPILHPIYSYALIPLFERQIMSLIACSAFCLLWPKICLLDHNNHKSTLLLPCTHKHTHTHTHTPLLAKQMLFDKLSIMSKNVKIYMNN